LKEMIGRENYKFSFCQNYRRAKRKIKRKNRNKINRNKINRNKINRKLKAQPHIKDSA